MSETPRSDALRRQWSDACNYEAALMEAMESHSSLERALAAAQAELSALKRGEFICRKCGLRKDGEHEPGDF